LPNKASEGINDYLFQQKDFGEILWWNIKIYWNVDIYYMSSEFTLYKQSACLILLALLILCDTLRKADTENHNKYNLLLILVK